MNCFDRIQSFFQEKPEKIALTGVSGQLETSCFSYEQLHNEIGLLNSSLSKLEVKAGDAILIEFSLCPQALVCILSCLSLGLIAVPISPNLSKQAFSKIVKDIRPALALVEVSNSNNQVQSFIYSDLIKSGTTAKLNFNVKNHKPVLLMHTSGSAGTPRKIFYNLPQLFNFMNRHNYLYRQFSDQSGKQKYESDLILTLPLSHFGGICLCLQALMMGRTLHMLQNFFPEDYLALARKKEVILLMMIPSMYEKLLDFNTVDKREKSKNTFKYCIAMGEPCSEGLMKALENHLNVKAFSTYGLSECQTGIGHEQVLVDEGKVPAGSCGRLLFGEVRLINNSGEQCNAGELWVRNETAFPCYSEHSLNHQAYYKGWFKTGDLLRRDKSGHYFHCGRKDSLFIVNGKNIYPLEVEEIFLQHSSFQTAIVLPLISGCGKTFPGVILKPKAPLTGRLPSKEVIIDFYISRGNIHSTPGWVMILEDIPLNRTGKIDRPACTKLLQHDYEKSCYRKAS